MSTLLHDVTSHAAFAVALPPQSMTEDATGPSVELPNGDGPVFAAVLIGNLDAGTVVAVTVQQSSDDSTWAAVATLPSATTANVVVSATFPRSARHLRCVVAMSGPSPLADVAVLVGQQKKVV